MTQAPTDVLAPQHVAIIMDGNGRWAKSRSLPRPAGHAKGAARVKDIIREADRLGIKFLSLYCFSTENWSRPAFEISALMQLLKDYLLQERQELLNNHIRLSVFGEIDALPAPVKKLLLETIELTKNHEGLQLNFCLNYGARAEIVRAVKQLVADVQSGKKNQADIEEKDISQRLYTAHTPDPDLVIRTSGEYRISNFLLWQVAYSEFYITDVLWPDFHAEDLAAACNAYSLRKRRFGKASHQDITDETIDEVSIDLRQNQ